MADSTVSPPPMVVSPMSPSPSSQSSVVALRTSFFIKKVALTLLDGVSEEDIDAALQQPTVQEKVRKFAEGDHGIPALLVQRIPVVPSTSTTQDASTSVSSTVQVQLRIDSSVTRYSENTASLVLVRRSQDTPIDISKSLAELRIMS